MRSAFRSCGFKRKLTNRRVELTRSPKQRSAWWLVKFLWWLGSLGGFLFQCGQQFDEIQGQTRFAAPHVVPKKMHFVGLVVRLVLPGFLRWSLELLRNHLVNL